MRLIISTLLFLLSGSIFAQSHDWIYATMEVQDAQLLKAEDPDRIEILNALGPVAAVYMDPVITPRLKQTGKAHGPGYIFRDSEESALQAVNSAPGSTSKTMLFDITEDDYVLQCISQVEEQNIANTIVWLENYGTRFNSTAPGVQASLDIKAEWESMVQDADRSDVSVEFFDHNFTDQKSVIVTFPGTETPDEIIIIGGHLDSGDYSLMYDAPGADDNASGIATLTETLRILLANDFHPKRTAQVMGYAAEEIGLYGSADIAESYLIDDKNVLGVLQFDMTNYHGSSYDINISDDFWFVSDELNDFLVELMLHYNGSGEHEITYGFSGCGYACSDHVSWYERGYPAAFPFEARHDQSNPYIHTPYDTFENMDNTAEHSTKFVKLALEFVIEAAKTNQLSTQDWESTDLKITVKDKSLIYVLGQSGQKIDQLRIYDTSSRKLIETPVSELRGSVSLRNYQPGIYVAVFTGKDGKTISKKFILR